MSFSTIFKRIPSLTRRSSARPPTSLVEADDAAENVYHSAPNSFFDQSVESIPALDGEVCAVQVCAAQECTRRGRCDSSSSEGEAEEGQCVFSYDEPSSSIFYVSNVDNCSSMNGLDSLSSCSSSLGSLHVNSITL